VVVVWEGPRRSYSPGQEELALKLRSEGQSTRRVAKQLGLGITAVVCNNAPAGTTTFFEAGSFSGEFLVFDLLVDAL